MKTTDIDTTNMCSHLRRKLMDADGAYHRIWQAVEGDPRLTAVVRSRQLHIYRNGRKVVVLKGTAFRGQPVPFVMELPNYRMPSAKSVGLLLWEKARDFLERAFTVIFLATIIIWFLQTFDAKLNVVTDSADSLLAMVGQFIAGIFRPLGFNDWRVATALISGFTAKEAVVSTLAVLLGTNTAALGSVLGTLFTPLSALSFLVFTLLYTPCIAAVATIRRELGSVWKMLGVVVLQCGVAWLAAMLVYRIGGLLWA